MADGKNDVEGQDITMPRTDDFLSDRINISALVRVAFTHLHSEILAYLPNGCALQGVGSLIVSDALHDLFPGSVPTAVVNRQTGEVVHCLVKMGDLYLDSEGIRTEAEVLERVGVGPSQEGERHLFVRPMGTRDASSMMRHPHLSNLLADRLLEHMALMAPSADMLCAILRITGETSPSEGHGWQPAPSRESDLLLRPHHC